jgi:hypothetical protein
MLTLLLMLNLLGPIIPINVNGPIIFLATSHAYKCAPNKHLLNAANLPVFVNGLIVFEIDAAAGWAHTFYR